MAESGHKQKTEFPERYKLRQEGSDFPVDAGKALPNLGGRLIENVNRKHRITT